MVVVGLTGNYGAGKSATLEEFSALGAFTLSADSIVAGLLSEPPVLKKVCSVIGPGALYPDGTVHKKAISQIIFNDEDKRRALEGVLHPMVSARIAEALLKARAKLAVVEVPLLFEAGMQGGFDRIVVVTSGRALSVKRLAAAGIPVNEARQRLHTQLPEIEKVRRADHVIINRKDRAALGSQVQALIHKLLLKPKKNSAVLHGFEEIDRFTRGMVVTLGNFDGVHVGHQRILATAAKVAGAEDAGVMALTFEPHPMKVLAPERGMKLLCTNDERSSLLMRCGAERVLYVPFTREFASMDAEDFIEEVLVARLGVRGVVVGHGYTFGRARKGDTALLRRRGEKFGFKVSVVRSVMAQGAKVSSSRIRSLLNWGRVCEAATLLGRTYAIHGTVVKGAGRGSAILGIPTANIEMNSELAPKKGVYAVRAELDGRLYDAVANLGDNPTFKGALPSQEVHIMDLDRNLLGEHIGVHFIERLREERRFDSIAALKAQILADIAEARATLRRKAERRPCMQFKEVEG